MNNNNKNILILYTSLGSGGGELYTVKQYKLFREKGCTVFLMAPRQSGIATMMAQEKLPFIPYHTFRISLFKKYYWQPFLEKKCLKICRKKNIGIIHVSSRHGSAAAAKIKRKHPVMIIHTRHIPDAIEQQSIEQADGIIGVSKQITAAIEQQCSQQLKVKKPIVFIPPLTNEQQFVSWTASTPTKEQFFKKHFGITITDAPIITTIANLYRSIKHKNHPCLFKAVALLKQKKQDVQVMLAGNGPNKVACQKLVKDLGIADRVHFLGFVTKHKAELLLHSDIKVLPSKTEGFGIVLLEAALMKKPIIAATNTGAAHLFVRHHKTGLLFENDNHEHLADMIEFLIDNPTYAQKLGQKAYKLYQKSFSNEKIIKSMLAFHEQVACR